MHCNNQNDDFFFKRNEASYVTSMKSMMCFDSVRLHTYYDRKRELQHFEPLQMRETPTHTGGCWGFLIGVWQKKVEVLVIGQNFWKYQNWDWDVVVEQTGLLKAIAAHEMVIQRDKGQNVVCFEENEGCIC